MENIVVLDFGSQYTQLIVRRIRGICFHSILLPADVPLTRIQSFDPAALVLSGGPRSVTESSAVHLPSGFFQYCRDKEIPVLGICYGLHIIVHSLGGVVTQDSKGGEYGRMQIQTERTSLLYQREENLAQSVWMSHHDTVSKIPEGFNIVARSAEGLIVAIENPELKIFGLQYHPEVSHSERGVETLRHFFTEICQVKGNWTMESMLENENKRLQDQIGTEDHVICALSGGVDSTVAAILVHNIIGKRLHCVFVDNGLLRYKEQERMRQMFKDHLHLPVVVVDRSQQMLDKLKGVADPEKKRKLIGAEFIQTFQEFQGCIEIEVGKKPKFLLQGTLYPDVIESCPPPGSDQKHSHTIKSHHNVGGLPPDLQFELVEPLKELFKDEVRKLGLLLGVPKQFIQRHPFPGPGLGVRILGDVTIADRLSTLRLVDEIFINSIQEFGLYDKIWQAFAVFLPVRSVGVQGDQRTHSHVVGLRAVTSEDGMTADWFAFDPQFLRTVSSRICNRVPDVNRVVYDITSKPPGTIEWE